VREENGDLLADSHNTPGSYQISEDLIQVGVETLLSAIHKRVNYISNKEELPDQWKDTITAPVYKKKL
jgi:hypothetical protein